jgi:hypothetical protein
MDDALLFWRDEESEAGQQRSCLDRGLSLG